MSKSLIIVFFCLFLCCCNEKPTAKLNSKKYNNTNTKIEVVEPNISTKKTEALKNESIKHYICYAMDNKTEVKIWIAFNQDNQATKIKYKGQNEFLHLEYIKEDYVEGEAYPTIKTYYNEILEGQINGTYILTHSGIWDYVEYTGVNDERTYTFTILHDENPYGQIPCFN